MKLKHVQMQFELKAISEKGEFSGYGSVFGVKDSYGDIVVKGAFAKSLAEWRSKSRLPPMLWQHRTAEPLGPWTLMREDEKGLYCEGQILLEAGETERRAYAHLRAGVVRELSIGYSISPNGIEYAKEANLLKEVQLWEISLVTIASNPEAQVEQVKAALEGGPKEFEEFLREVGLSRNQARGLMAKGYDGLRTLREVGDGDQVAVKALQKTLDVLRGLRAKESR